MIKSAAISDLLRKSIEKDIDMVFISRLTGEILCSEKKSETENELIPDILSSAFSEYLSLASDQNEKLNMLIIENEDSNLICAPLYDYFLAMKGKKELPLGKLKAHLKCLKKNLETTLDPFIGKLIPPKKEEEE